MAFDKQELAQLGELLDNQRSLITLDVKTLLRPIVQDIEKIKERLDQLFRMINEDVGAAYKDIVILKRKVARMEREIAVLKGR